jgi:uncharacterized protein YukE
VLSDGGVVTGKGYKINVTEVAPLANDLRAASGQAAQLLSTLQSGISDLGGFAGDDENGQKFAQAFSSAFATLQVNITQLAETLEGMGDAISDSVLNVVGAEENSSTQFNETRVTSE